MNTSVIPNSTPDESNTVISIPLSKKDLGGFISDLLGQKQSLERTYDITFEIDHSWLMNLHEMIDQRISQQSNSHLINFTAVVYFDNGAKRTITTLEAFRAYHETKPEISNGIKIVWEYLVQFPNRPHPEKQQISFTASIYDHKHTENKFFLDRHLERLLTNSKDSLINIQIDHTERTWGDDIENIISSCVADATESYGIAFFAIQLARMIMTVAIIGFMMVYPLYNALTASSDSLVILQQEFEKLQGITYADTRILSQKLDMIFSAVTKIETSRSSSTIMLLASSITGPFVAALFLAITRTSQQSHVLLSNKARQLQVKLQKRSKNTITIIVLSYIASIGAGIIGNYGFQFLNG
ncbi:hypothetical protein ACS0KQ_003548 [Vibrio cholerae]